MSEQKKKKERVKQTRILRNRVRIYAPVLVRTLNFGETDFSQFLNAAKHSSINKQYLKISLKVCLSDICSSAFFSLTGKTPSIENKVHKSTV